MKSTRGVLITIVALILAVTGFFLAIVYFRPLAQTLELKTIPTSAMDVAQVALLQQAATTVPDKKIETCGLTGFMTILNLGLSTELPSRPVAAESIRIVRFDFDKMKVMVFTLPRDLVLQTPALKEKYKIDQSQLGDVYSVVLAAEEKSVNPDDAGYKATQATAQVIYDSFEVAADHYIAMDNQVMWDSIDILGGITVKMKQEFKAWDGEPFNGLMIPKGEQKINGLAAHALYVIRNSSPEEWDRTERQDAMYDGLFTQLINVDTVAKAPELFQLFKEKIVTDLSPAQIVSLACVAKETPLNKAKLDEVPINEVIIQNDGSFLLKDFDKTKHQIQNFLQDK